MPTGSSAGRLEVDISQLAACSNTFNNLAERLSALDNQAAGGSIDHEAFGNRGFATDVNAFVENWADGRKKLVAFLHELGAVSSDAATSYRAAEATLNAAMKKPS